MLHVCGRLGLACLVLLCSFQWALAAPQHTHTIKQPTSAVHWLHGEDGAPLWVGQGAALKSAFKQQISPVLRGASFVRLGVRWDGAAHLMLMARFSQDQKQWTGWIPMVRTFDEVTIHNSHADPPSGRAKFAQIKIIGQGTPTFVAAELIPRLGPMTKPQTSSGVTVVPPASGDPRGRTSTQSYGLTGPFNARSVWKAQAAKCSSFDRTKNRIAIHHTVTPNNDTSSPESRLRGIQNFHQGTRGWCDIGYHLLISQDGRAWEGRPAEVLGSHVGSNNKGTIGISFMGTFTSVTPNNKMLCTGAKLIDWIVKTFSVKRDRTVIMGHRQFPQNSTTCPGDKLYAQIGYMITQSSSSTCTAGPPPPPVKCDYVEVSGLNAGGKLNVRGGSSTTFAIKGTVTQGDCLKVLGKQDGQDVNGETTWYNISAPGGLTGWISGYYATCSTCGVSEDKEPPTVTIISPQENASFTSASVEVTGEAKDNTKVKQVEVNGVVATLDANGGFKATVVLKAGAQVITATATDEAGNKGDAKVNVTLVPAEPPTEPTNEPSVTEAAAEPAPVPDAAAPDQVAPTPDQTQPAPDLPAQVKEDGRLVIEGLGADNAPPAQGCGCHSSSSGGSVWMMFLLCLVIFGVRKRR